MIIRTNKKWPSIDLPKINKLLDQSIDNLRANPTNENREIVFRLLKDSKLLVGVDKIPRRKRGKMHTNMLAVTSPGNRISLLVFTNKETLVAYSPESSILLVDLYHIFEACYDQYNGSLILCSSKQSIEFSSEQIQEMLQKWHEMS